MARRSSGLVDTPVCGDGLHLLGVCISDAGCLNLALPVAVWMLDASVEGAIPPIAQTHWSIAVWTLGIHLEVVIRLTLKA